MDELQQAFVQESGEQLVQLEDTLLLLEQNPHDAEAINTLFRSAHTIKGAAGVVECDYIVAFTHVVENLLDQLRDGNLSVTPDLIALLLNCKDHMAALLDIFAGGAGGPNEDLLGRGDTLSRQLKSYLPEAGPRQGVTAAAVPDVESVGGGLVVATDNWHISLRFAPHVLKNGMDPLPFLRYLASLGEIVHMATLFDAMPGAEEMDPESCYLGFEIDFRSGVTKADIERVFQFVLDDCELRILSPHSRLSEYIKLIQDLPEDTMRLGEILVKAGAVTLEELEEGLRSQCQAMQEPVSGEVVAALPLGEILVDNKVVHKEIVEAAAAKQTQVSEKKAQEAKLIRVQADKLDSLIDLVGELVIAGAAGALTAQKSGKSNLVEAYSLISRLVEEIRNSALQLRMVQIGETFNRFHRVVRDTSRELGKEIELVINGGDTELDKSVVEKIGDPLMHLVRNAMDHGLETAEVRVARGKPAKGQVHFNAYHDSGSIVIEVSDDGNGLNRDRILAKAIERGLVNPAQVLTDPEVYKLVFEPGFSTADKVTNLSGRGVGMDVVKRNIEALRGTVDVESQPGNGSTFRIRLPLTLAIIDGFLVGVGRAAYIIPLDFVVECMELRGQETSGRDYLNLRGEVLPFVRLRELFEVRDVPVSRRQNIVVVQYAGHKAGLVVDHLMGEFQTVIKPLGQLFRNIQGISGSTILGSGEVALILDVPTLVQNVAANESTRHGVTGPQPALLR
ncbi:MAG: chemotaxis protein CheA [Thiobacillus sp.]|nr:chemotaxis protein CheA [Thiobacillus sp.]